MSSKVLENIAQDYDNVRKGVYDVMGGQVLEYETKTIFNEGRLSERKDMAIEMFHDGQPLEKIAKYARESVETIQKWLDEGDVG